MELDFTRLTGGQRKVLRLALVEAFDSRELDRFLVDHHFDRLENLSTDGDFEARVFDLIESLFRAGDLGRLMEVVLEEKSKSPALQDLESRLLAAGSRSTSTPTDDPPRDVWMVPHGQNPYFTAREDALSALYEALHGDGCAVVGQTQAISGLGGIGKTQTAVEYSYRHRDEYEAVLWVRGATEGDLAAGFGEVAQELCLAAAVDAEQRLAAVHGWMDANTSWLLVIDNADDPDLLKPYLPTTYGGHILLTSRASYFGPLSIRRPLRLNILSPEDARAFLLKRVGRDSYDVAEEKAAGALAEELGFLPLALEQAGAYVAAKQAHLEDYLEAYRERRGRLLGRSKPETGEYLDGVATTWALNFEEVERASRTSADVLRFSAFLSPELIPEELLESGLKQPSLFQRFAAQLCKVFLRSEKAADYDPLAVDELLEQLIRFSLVERDLDSRSFRVHRLVQEVVKENLDETSRRRWEKRVVRCLNQSFPIVEFGSWGQCARLLPHVLAFRLGAVRSLESLESAGVFGRAAQYLHTQGRYAEAESLYEQTLAIQEKVLGGDHLDIAVTLNNLALLYKYQGRYAEAELLFERDLAITENAKGSDHLDIAVTLNNLANLYRDQGRYAEAEPLFERSRAIAEKALPGDHPDLARLLSSQGRLYRDQGRYAEAELLSERSLAIREKVLGGDHPDLATSLGNLANLYRDQGRYAEAEPLFERSLAIREKVLGGDHPDLATSLGNLANLYRDQGRYAEAEPLYERSQAIMEKALGGDHPDLARSLYGLANLYRDQGRYAEAEPMYKRSQAIMETAVGGDHPDLVAALNNLANLFRIQGRHEEADELTSRAESVQN